MRRRPASESDRHSMESHAPKSFPKVLLTPDPHYIPGYRGYCPQLKFHMGKSYAKLTAELLTSPEVKHSSRLVFHTGHVLSTEPNTAAKLSGIPDSNLKKMIPGYTGFVPRSRDHFGCSFSESCGKALSEFYKEASAKIQQPSTGLPAAVVFSAKEQSEAQTRKLPFTALSNKVFVYKPLKSFSPLGSPYLMGDDDPHKHFISGFTGHVPESRYHIGKSYSIITNQALIQFGKQQRRDPTSKVTVREKNTVSLPKIYPTDRGMVPSFTGHIPGYKFMYGHTFGQLSQDALKKSGIKRIHPPKTL